MLPLSCLLDLARLDGLNPLHHHGHVTKQLGFGFTVEEVFYIKPPVDRVILVGTVNEGSVKVGESLKVRCQGERRLRHRRSPRTADGEQSKNHANRM